MKLAQLKVRLKKIGWNLKEFAMYNKITQRAISNWDDVPQNYVNIVELLEHDKIKALELKNNLLEELEKEKTKSD